MRKEIFKDIPNYKGFYQISDLGNVKSLPRKDNLNRKVYTKILKPAPNKKGYLMVVLSKNNIKKTRKVHQLVAETFLNHIPCGMKLVVDHINFDKKDNRVDNLNIITNKENLNRKYTQNGRK